MNHSNRLWRREKHSNSLPEVFSSIHIPKDAGFFKRLFAFAGPGLMIAVGYMDPGNWATDIAGGAQFGYTLLSVILISNLFSMILQHLSLKLGIVAERDLAQACRDHFGPKNKFHPMDSLRNCDCCMRSGRSYRFRDCAEFTFRNSTHLGSGHYHC